MDELNKLEEKIDKLVDAVNELKLVLPLVDKHEKLIYGRPENCGKDGILERVNTLSFKMYFIWLGVLSFATHAGTYIFKLIFK